MYRFEIFRYDRTKDEEPRFQVYDLAADEKASVLEGLLKIQDEQDPSLAFRYACRGAVCGSCAMSINGKLDLACRVLLGNLRTTKVVIEPLPNLEIIRDLVVDMDPFWEKYEQVKPWLESELSGEKESRMSEAQREKIDQYVNCILCGLCYGACPMLKSNPRFTGPAALAKLYRFLADSRDERDGTVLPAGGRSRRRLGMSHHHPLHRRVSQAGSPHRRDRRRAAEAGSPTHQKHC